jgi:hypothetical protein
MGIAPEVNTTYLQRAINQHTHRCRTISRNSTAVILACEIDDAGNTKEFVMQIKRSKPPTWYALFNLFCDC